MSAPFAAASAPGDVYVAGGGAWIVLAAEGDRAAVAPIFPSNTAPRRHDVPIEAPPDLMAMGVTGRDCLIRVAEAIVRSERGYARVGRASPDLLAQVLAAAAREGEARRIEASRRRA